MCRCFVSGSEYDQKCRSVLCVVLSYVILFGGLIFVLGDWQSCPKFLTVSSLLLPLPHFIFLLCSEPGITEEPFCALPLLCSLSCLADLGCHHRGPFLPRALFKIPVLQWCVKNSQRCWKTSNVWDSFYGIVTYLDPRGPQTVRGKKKGPGLREESRKGRPGDLLRSRVSVTCSEGIGCKYNHVVPVLIFAEGLKQVFQSTSDQPVSIY